MVHRPVVGVVRVEYSQIYVESGPDAVGPGLPEAFAGQNSGLCGAAVPGALWLHTGLHTGSVGFCVEVHDRAPHLDPAWEDVVEARGQDTRLDGQPHVDRYLLQFWPGEPAPDRILKQTAAIAAYWHDYARELPAPPSPAERAEAERRARLARERAAEQRRSALEQRQWGGQSPSRALRAVGGNVRGLVAFDAALVHAIDAAGAATQRAVARLAAHRACEAAGLDQLDWVRAGLAALDEGRPLPPPLDDPEQAWRALAADPRVPDRTVGRAVPPARPPFRPPAPHDERPQTARPAPARRVVGPAAGGAESPRPPVAPTPRACEGAGHSVQITRGEPDPGLRMSQPHMALPALLDAAAADPLRAALDAVYAGVAAYGEDHPALLDEVRSRCQGA